MSLKESLSGERGKLVPGPKCGLHLIRQQLPADELAVLDDAISKVRKSRDEQPLGNSGYNCAWIHRALVNEGFDLKILTVQRHVAFTCACGY